MNARSSPGESASRKIELDRTEGFLGALIVAIGGAVVVRFLIAVVTPRR